MYYIYKPIPLRSLYKKQFIPVVSHNPEYTHLIEERRFKGRTFRILKCGIDQSSDKLLVWFHGGSFVQETYDNILPFLVEVAETNKCHVLTFDYPLLYTAKLHETLKYINTILREFFVLNEYKDIYYGGESAGTYLALKTIEIEYNQALRNVTDTQELGVIPKGFIGICGFYDPTFNGKPLAKYLMNMWFWRVQDMQLFINCNLNVPALIVSSSRDFLATQSQRFVDSQPRHLTQYEYFITPNTLHCFVANTTLSETRDTIEIMKNFMSKD